VPDPFTDPLPPRGALDPAANPFRPGMGRVPPAFGGREPALAQAKLVVDRLARGTAPEFVLYRGVRGVGKTALLAYVRQQAALRGVATAHLEADRDDAELVRARDTLRQDTAGLLTNPGPTTGSSRRRGGTFESLLAELRVALTRRERGLLLTVDEVHEAGGRLLEPLLRGAHRAAQDDVPFGLLLSGLPTAAETLFDEGQTYTERLQRVDLELLDRTGTAEAVGGPFARVGVEVDELVIDAVHDGSGGYPWFVQLWGESLWDVARRPDRVELQDARAAGEAVHVRTEAFFADRWRRVPSGRATDLVLALAQHDGDAAVADLLDALDLTHQAIAPARRALLDLGILWAPSRGRLAFTVPGFASYLERTRPERAR
jgi:hypothetical protein